MDCHTQLHNRFSSRSHTTLAGLLVVALAAGIAGGCTSNTVAVTSDNPDQDFALEPHSQPPVPDLPVPFGFQLMEQISRSYEAREVRFVDHVYNGRAGKAELERFYQKQLPARGWEFQSAQMVGGTRTLRFTKHDEILNVVIQDDDRPFRDAYTRVHLAVHPQGASIQTPDF